jgi:hypothetical protein
VCKGRGICLREVHYAIIYRTCEEAPTEERKGYVACGDGLLAVWVGGVGVTRDFCGAVLDVLESRPAALQGWVDILTCDLRIEARRRRMPVDF